MIDHESHGQTDKKTTRDLEAMVVAGYSIRVVMSYKCDNWEINTTDCM
jgi:hypothetical protein